MNSEELLRDNDRLRILNGRLVRFCLDKGMTAEQVNVIAEDMDRPLPYLVELQPAQEGGAAIEAELRRELDAMKKVLKGNEDNARSILTERSDFETKLAVLHGQVSAMKQTKSDSQVETVAAEGAHPKVTSQSDDELPEAHAQGRPEPAPAPPPIDPESDDVFSKPPQRRGFR